MLLDKLAAAVAPLGLERTHPMRRLAAAGAVIAAHAAEDHTLKVVTDALDELYAAIPHDAAWEEHSRLFERAHDQIAVLWAHRLAGASEA